jgi:hypothetical protein
MRRGLLVAALVCAVAAPGCAESRTAGEIPASAPASVPAHAPQVGGRAISGVVTDGSGRPAAGASVVVTVALSGSEQAVRGFSAFSSLGLSCLLGCSAPHVAGFSARDGSFALALPGPNKARDDYRLTIAAARGDAARVATSVILPWARRLPGIAMELASGTPQIRKLGNRRWVVPPELPLRYAPSHLAVSLSSESGSPPVVAGHSLDVTRGYDARVVEDERLLLTTSQTGRQHGREAIFSSSLEVRGDAIPASRGSRCRVTGSRGQAIRQPSCGLTDGDLEDGWQATDDPRCADGPCPGAKQHDHRDVTITLRRPINAALVVVRGCLGCSVMTSPDGHRFTTVATAPFGGADDLLVRNLAGARVSAVRIRTDTGGFFSSLREVSVFSRS